MFNNFINLNILNLLAFGGSITPTNQPSFIVPFSPRFVSFHSYNPSTNISDSNFPFGYLDITPSINSSGGFITNSNVITTSSVSSPFSINYSSFWYGDDNSKTLLTYSLLAKPLELTAGDSITIESNQLVITFA